MQNSQEKKNTMMNSIPSIKHKAIFKMIWGKLQPTYGSQTTQLFLQNIYDNQSMLEYFSSLSFDELCENVNSIMVNTSVQKKTEMINENPEPNYSDKQSMGQTKKKQKKQEKFQEDQIKKSEMAPQVNQLHEFVARVFEIIKGYQHFTTFQTNHLKAFQKFYEIYRTYPLIPEYKLKTTVRKAVNKVDDQAFLIQLQLVNSALYYSTDKHQLRITQVFAIYCFLFRPEVKKILLQILTGEGKTTTIACLASILTIRGEQVDIITTSNLLAERDAEEQRYFYELLGLKAVHNLEKDPKAKLQPKKCYEKMNIVYGTPHSYQVDILYDEYKKKNTRNARPYKTAIVDEVDSMFVDEKGHQTLLSTTYAGFAELLIPMKILWQTIIKHNIALEKNEFYLYMQGEKKDEVMRGKATEVMRVIIKDVKSKFSNQIVPEWKRQFVQLSLQNWVRSAIQAAHIYKKDYHYTIQNENIVPIDYSNTGCLQHNVQWENGLHQFLQMKHGLNVSTEGMTSNFLSNLGHFGKYEKLYGLTGTLGSKQSKRFLQQTYKVEQFEVPPYQKRLLEIQPGFMMRNEQNWIRKIAERLEFMMKKQRSVLVICESIGDVHNVKLAVETRKIKFRRLQCLTTGEEKYNDRIGCNEIFIATNIAGRGTDLKAQPDLRKKGGLHVIIGFMPNNLRVQMQGRGRAGRNGAPGSSQVIVNYERYMDDEGIPRVSEEEFITNQYENHISFFNENVRDDLEKKRMKKDQEIVKDLRIKDEIFSLYCQQVNKIPDFQTNKAKRDAIEEQWAMFLKRIQFLKIPSSEVKVEAKKLIGQFVKNSENFYNPGHHAQRGIEALSKNNLKGAQKCFKEATEGETNLSAKLAGTVLGGATTININPKNKTNVKAGLQKMKNSFQLIEKKKDMSQALHAVSLTEQNQQVEKILEGEEEKNREKLKKSLQENSKVSGIKKADEKSYNKIEKEGEKMMDIAQTKVLDSISQHIKDQMRKFQNLGQNEYIQFTYVPLTDIIDKTAGKEEDLEEVTNNLAANGLPVLPKANVKKIKTPWWKRALVFCLGVLQVCVGALIMGASAGAASSFGMHMIISGTQDCYNALFKPQVCNDLKKYFSQKALEYTAALVMVGAEGIKELATMSRNGFSVLKGSTMSEVMKKVGTGIVEGLGKLPFDYEGICKNLVMRGITSKLSEKNNDFQKEIDTTKVIKKNSGELKKVIDKQCQDENNREGLEKYIEGKFEQDSQKIIRKIVRCVYPEFLAEIRKFQIPQNHLQILINESFKKNFQAHFNPENRSKIYERMMLFITKNLERQDLAKILIKQFNIEDMIIKTLKDIPRSENYAKVLQSAKNEFNSIVNQEIQRVHKKYQGPLEKKSNQLNAMKKRIEKDPLTIEQRNKLVEEYNEKATCYTDSANTLNDFVEKVDKINKTSGYFDEFTKKGLIKDGQIVPGMKNVNGVHKYIKEALSNVKLDSNTDHEFQEFITIRAYNTYAAIAMKALQVILNKSSNSAGKVMEFKDKLESLLKKE